MNTAEFDPAAELGLFPDKFFVCNINGFINRNNSFREICRRTIEDGEHFLDVRTRYDDITSYVIGRDDAIAGTYVSWLSPFLKANGLTDAAMNRICKESLDLMPGAKETVDYISTLLPSYILTSEFYHAVLPTMEALDDPPMDAFYSEIDLDVWDISVKEAIKVREIEARIKALDVPEGFYELNVPVQMDPRDIAIMELLDEVIRDPAPLAGAYSLVGHTTAFTSHKKAYKLLDLRRTLGIDLDSIFYVGSERTDFQPMDLVRDGRGISLAFNGEDFAVRGSNVAVLSEDTTVVSLLLREFYDRGYQAVVDLANNWSREYIRNMDYADGNLVENFLGRFGDDLPEVYLL
ncbi:MAG: hypothetical protein IJ856_06970, partial [Candidatus Methanomethylophilaceae archaeon]|nr:hypothetical protein [Candidatus Methanomethylophilaceae archaeon]